MSRKFRLAIVLRLREIEEDAARGRLGVAVRDHVAALADRDGVAQRLADEHEWLRGLQERGGDSSELRTAAEALGTAEGRLSRAEETLAKTAQALLEARALLAQATKRREVVERLRDRHLAAERDREEKAEIARLSELANVQYAFRDTAEPTR